MFAQTYCRPWCVREAGLTTARNLLAELRWHSSPGQLGAAFEASRAWLVAIARIGVALLRDVLRLRRRLFGRPPAVCVFLGLVRSAYESLQVS